MADIFISYSKVHRSLTEGLARDLERSGYSVWWDTELVGGDEFKNVILEELDAAQAVIVIWTPAAVTSNWVYSEANRAQAQNKLITVKSADVDFRKIPPPFDTLHVDPLEARERIFMALGKIGVELGRGARPRIAADESLWDEVRSLRDPQLYIHYLKTFPFGTHAHEADAIIWRGVAASDTAQSYLWYLNEFPGGLYSTEAEEGYWRHLASQNTFEAYADYLKNRPRGRYRDAADAALWQAASVNNSISAYNYYLAASPSGVSVEVAKLRLARLKAEEKKRRDEEQARQRAIHAEKLHRDAEQLALEHRSALQKQERRLETVRMKLESKKSRAQEEREWDAARGSQDLNQIQAYLQKWPTGFYADEAKWFLKKLDKREKGSLWKRFTT